MCLDDRQIPQLELEKTLEKYLLEKYILCLYKWAVKPRIAANADAYLLLNIKN